MKIDRHNLLCRQSAVKLRHFVGLLLIVAGTQVTSGQPPASSPSISSKSANAPQLKSQPQAIELLNQVIERLANGPAFAAKFRQRVWTAGREVIGIGIYEQSGAGSGCFNLHLSMHDGNGKHTLQQTSDGRITWTRSVIADEVSLKRVDVGRLDEWVRGSTQRGELSPRLRIGAWTEMLDTTKRDYILKAGITHLDSKQVLVISGTMKDASRERVVQEAKLESLPGLYPSLIKIAINLEDDPTTGFGKGLPIRFEFWSLPQPRQTAADDASDQRGNLVSLIELHSFQRIKPPPMDRFRLDTKDAVSFVNETDRYLRRYGIHLTEHQRRKLLR